MNPSNQAKIDMLIESLNEKDGTVRDKARNELIHLGKEAVPSLIKALESHTERCCWESAKVLMEIDDPRWLAPMFEALKSPNIILCQIALQAIATQNEISEDVLLRTLSISNLMLQPHVIKLLAERHIHAAIPHLIEIMKDTESALIRYTAIEALIELNATEALDIIATFASNEDAHVRKRVATAIEKLAISDKPRD